MPRKFIWSWDIAILHLLLCIELALLCWALLDRLQ